VSYGRARTTYGIKKKQWLTVLECDDTAWTMAGRLQWVLSISAPSPIEMEWSVNQEEGCRDRGSIRGHAVPPWAIETDCPLQLFFVDFPCSSCSEKRGFGMELWGASIRKAYLMFHTKPLL
jgi:hypothetical protein